MKTKPSTGQIHVWYALEIYVEKIHRMRIINRGKNAATAIRMQPISGLRAGRRRSHQCITRRSRSARSDA
jgi:hypothetical protein